MTNLIHELRERLGTEDGGIGGLLLAIIVVIAIIVVALIQWVF